MHYQRWRAHGSPLTKLTLKGEPLENRFAQQVDRSENATGCHLWTGVKSRGGYGSITVEGKNQLAHRVSWFLANGRWPTDDILHSCDNPPCVNPEHLSEGTHSDNMRQMIERDRRLEPVGEHHHAAKLTYDDVCQVRHLRACGWTLKSLADRFGVHPSTIDRVVKHQIWRGGEDELRAA